MSDSQSSNTTHGELEINLEPDVTDPQQQQVVNVQEEPEIDVVGLDINEHVTPGEGTCGVELGKQWYPVTAQYKL